MLQVDSEQSVITLPYNYEPRDYQLSLLAALDSGVKRALVVWPRRHGKDLTAWNWVIKTIWQRGPMVAYYCLPTQAQARKVIFDSITSDGTKFLDFIPKDLVASCNRAEMKITLRNGSLLQLVGSDNYDSLVGTNPRIIVFSEYAISDPEAWSHLRPILLHNGGTAVFISTTRGKNHFYDLYTHARSNPDWFCELLTNDDTKLLTPAQLAEEKASGMSEEMIQQEYFCSWDRGVEGSYYGRILEAARREGRITKIPYESSAGVNTAWDIGYGDSTSITFWQQIGVECRIIDYYESHGEKLAHYVKAIQSKPYVYGTHYMPHDANAGSLQTGHSLVHLAGELGLKAIVLPRDDLDLGIEATRSLLETCWIDEIKCAPLIKSLENYCRKYNEKLNVYSETPMHSWASHGADSVRYMAMARLHYGKGAAGGLSADKIREMRMKFMGY